MSVHHLFVTAVAAPASAESTAATVSMSSGRVGASVAVLLGLAGAIIGGVALARPTGRLGAGSGRLGAVLAVAAGLLGMALGALVVATSDSGIGTGNGRGGAYLAVVVGLVSAVLGGLALARARRTDGLTG
ncbi:hypothetical protein EV382_0474 [Micromonospora violae]|uniref:Uncharacterized protein n=1 Tax=Micromonospora violae TaxID=1278207 RepID=A0A4Q7U8S6_9ACTN|nr:DUF6223 family protein [Micromonospora violae]RZT77325.1 hypothetical protein EV382_0474 [Micromonospora violae]